MKKGYLSLEITTSRVRYIYAEKVGKYHEILKADGINHTLDPAAPGGLATAIDGIIDKEAISPKRIFVTIARNDTLIRQVTMPSMNQSEIDEAVGAEIEKIPSFSKRAFDYIFHSYEAELDRWRVLFAAIDQTVLTYILEEIQSLGIDFRHAEIAPLNLHKLIKAIHDVDEAQATLVVNDHASYLIVSKEGETRLFYQSANGAASLYPDQNASIDDSVLNALSSELSRVLKSFLAENKQDSINKIWLVYDKPRCAELREKLSEKIRINMEDVNLTALPYLTAIDGSSTNNPINILAATPLFFFVGKEKEQYPLKHFFRAFQVRNYIVKAVTISLIVLGLIGFVVGGLTYGFYQNRLQYEEKTKKLATEVRMLKAESKPLYRERKEYLEIRQGLLDQASFVQTLNRVSWSEVLELVSEEMPENLALTSFQFKKSGSVKFMGQSFNMESVSELIRRVDDSVLLDNGAFEFLKEREVFEQKLFDFGIRAKLRKPEEKNDN